MLKRGLNDLLRSEKWKLIKIILKYDKEYEKDGFKNHGDKYGKAIQDRIRAAQIVGGTNEQIQQIIRNLRNNIKNNKLTLDMEVDFGTGTSTKPEYLQKNPSGRSSRLS